MRAMIKNVVVVDAMFVSRMIDFADLADTRSRTQFFDFLFDGIDKISLPSQEPLI